MEKVSYQISVGVSASASASGILGNDIRKSLDEGRVRSLNRDWPIYALKVLYARQPSFPCSSDQGWIRDLIHNNHKPVDETISSLFFLSLG
jgi:hypothetical protein